MKKLATVTAVLAALGAIGSQSPANAAMGQCFDGSGRPFGPPQNTDNPNYGMICQAYRVGGHCTHVGAGWAESNCGIGPRYNRGQYQQPRYYDSPRYDYRPRRSYDSDTPANRRDGYRNQTPNTPNIPQGTASCAYADPARCRQEQNNHPPR
jgi:hypothetical protein